MGESVGFQKMIFTAISGELQLRANTKHRACVLGLSQRLFGAGQVSLEIHGPLIEAARCYFHQPHRAPRTANHPRTWPSIASLPLPLPLPLPLRSPRLAIRTVRGGLWNETPNSQYEIPRGAM